MDRETKNMTINADNFGYSYLGQRDNHKLILTGLVAHTTYGQIDNNVAIDADNFGRSYRNLDRETIT